jgi:hypothetical protein
MDHEGQGSILLSVRDGEELLPQGTCCGVISSRSVKYPPPTQDLRDLEGICVNLTICANLSILTRRATLTGF